MNLVHLSGVDGTDPDSMTRGEVEGRRQAMLAIEALRRFMPGFKGVRLRNFGMTIGIRDTRKIDAICNMTEADVRNEGRFKDTLGIYPEFIDGYGILIIPTTGRTMHIPYRSMLPKGVKGLLVAGRAIGGDMDAGAIRAAGARLYMHAGIAQRLHRGFHFLDHGVLQEHLSAGNCRRAGIAARLDPV